MNTNKPTLKNIIGIFLVIGVMLLWVVDLSFDTYEDFGWYALGIVPLTIAAVLALIAFINWLLD